MAAQPSPTSSGRSIAATLVLLTIGTGLMLLEGCKASREAAPGPNAAPGSNSAAAPVLSSTPDRNQVAVLETTSGKIVFEFLPDIAPLHTVAFQNMFRSGFFDGTIFHRVIPKQAVQGGGPMSKDDYPFDDGMVPETLRRIPAEFSTKVKHARGVVAAAHLDGDVDSATSQFFIETKSNPMWDGKYTIFGRVIEGMEIVDQMVNAPLRTAPKLLDRPADPVRITKAYLAPRDSIGSTKP
ncbi:MAG: peptidylprolyl isomerase [Acidobacteria bacterium]|nr:peptidylprolyl isomerase [Acidobacteriota bacterium]